MSKLYRGIFLAASIAFALTACGLGNDDSGMTCSPAPQITSTPPAFATAGYRYLYSVDASHMCGGMFLPYLCGSIHGVQMPAGSAIDVYYDVITWTPTADQANTDVKFVIATDPDPCGASVSQSWAVHVYPGPVIESFTAARAAVSPGESASITAVFQGSGSIDGLGKVTSGEPIATPVLKTSTTFTLTVTNGYGAEVHQTLTIQVLAPPAIQSFSVSPSTITAGDTTTLMWSATGDFSAHLDPPGVDVSGSNFAVTPASTTTYTLTLSNAAGASVSASVQVAVVAPPAIDGFTATPTSSVLRGTVSLLARFRNGTGEIVSDDITAWTSLGAVDSGAEISSSQLLRTTHFQLVVRNAAGTAATQDLIVPITGPGTFQPTSGQPVGPLRRGHTATRLLDGRVFIAGGLLDGVSSAATEIFDPSTETFAAGPSLIEGRHDHAAALLPDGRVLLVGGYRTDGTRILNAEIYDPGGGTVTSAGELPVTDMVLPEATALLDGRVLVVHGSLGQGSEVFSAGTFTSAGPLNASHGCIRAERLSDGRVLVIDGSFSSEIFSPGPDSFTLTDAVTHARCYFSSAVLPDGRVLITGGTSSGVPAEIYDPAAGLFSDAGSQQYPAPDGGTANTLAGGAVLAVGGWWAELFDPGTGTFSLTGGCNANHRFHTATVLQDGRVLVFGGCSTVPCAEIYTPQ